MAKKDIDFDVYQKANPESQVDWAKAAKDITQTFETIRDDRQTRKDELLKSYQEQQEALNDLGEYDSPTTQQLVMNAGTDAAEKMTNYRDLMTRGLVKPADMNMFEHNVSTGFTLLKKNALAYDTLFKEVTLRTKDGTNAATEQWRATLLESFGRLENAQIQTNPETGELSFLRLEPPFITNEKGDKVKNPKAGKPVLGGSMSLQQMTLLMKQKTNSIDIEKKVKDIKSNLGSIVLTFHNMSGRRDKITSKEMSRLETQFFESEEGKEYLRLKASELQVGEDAATLITQTNQVNSNGERFKPGTEDEYKAWEKKNKDKGTTTFDVPPLKDKSEGTAFRKWIRETHPEYAKDFKGEGIDATGSNSFIKDAYSEYGEEYARDVLKIEGTTTKTVNPILIQNFENQLYTTDLTPEQRGVSDKVAMDQVTISLDYKESDKVSYMSAGRGGGGGGDDTEDPDYRTYLDYEKTWNLGKKGRKGENNDGEYIMTNAQKKNAERLMNKLLRETDKNLYSNYNRDNGVWQVYKKGSITDGEREAPDYIGAFNDFQQMSNYVFTSSANESSDERFRRQQENARALGKKTGELD
jgi:hypothetical protein